MKDIGSQLIDVKGTSAGIPQGAYQLRASQMTGGALDERHVTRPEA